MIADGVNVKKHRPRNVPGTVLGVRVTLLRRQKHGAVDHGDIAVAQVLGQPVGRLEPAVGSGGSSVHLGSQQVLEGRLACLRRLINVGATGKFIHKEP